MQSNNLYIPLELVKSQLNIDEWFDGDDFYLTHLIQVCQEAVEKHIDHPFEDLEDENGDLPSPIAHAILLLCGTYYDNRESITHSNAVKIPHSFDYLVDLYRDYAPSLNNKNQKPIKRHGNRCFI